MRRTVRGAKGIADFRQFSLSTVFDRRRFLTRRRPLLLLLVLVSITVIALDQMGTKGPVHSVRGWVRDGFVAVGDNVSALNPLSDSREVRRLKRENSELTSQLERARGEAAQSSDARRDRDHLNALLALPTPEGVGRVIAPVTSVENGNFNSTIEIGRGSDHGVAVGMPVVTGEGLAGRVVRTSGQRATVLLLTDTTSNVGIRIGETGEIGLGVGQGAGRDTRVDLVELNSAVKQGDIAVTNGLQKSLFPPGIPVGRITEVSGSSQSFRRQVKMAPLVRYSSLDNVAVLQWRPQP